MSDYILAFGVILYSWLGLFLLTKNGPKGIRSDSGKIFFGLYKVFLWPIPIVYDYYRHKIGCRQIQHKVDAH
jgi:hypothetical protein